MALSILENLKKKKADRLCEKADYTINASKAISYYTRAIKVYPYHAEALFKIGDLYRYGKTLSATLKIARSRTKDLRGRTLSYAEREASVIKPSDKIKIDYEKTFYYYAQAAKLGHVKAYEQMAGMYFRGEGEAKDYDKAFKIYQQLLNKKARLSSYSWATLGHIYVIRKNYDNAMICYQNVPEKERKSLDWGNLGLMYKNGLGVLQNEFMAIKCLQRASEMDTVAPTIWMKNLADVYMAYKPGGETHYREALNWYTKALSHVKVARDNKEEIQARINKAKPLAQKEQQEEDRRKKEEAVAAEKRRKEQEKKEAEEFVKIKAELEAKMRRDSLVYDTYFAMKKYAKGDGVLPSESRAMELLELIRAADCQRRDSEGRTDINAVYWWIGRDLFEGTGCIKRNPEEGFVFMSASLFRRFEYDTYEEVAKDAATLLQCAEYNTFTIQCMDYEDYSDLKDNIERQLEALRNQPTYDYDD